MKQLIIFLLLSISLFGQIKKEIPNGYFWSDSLYQTYIDTTATPDDTLTASLTSHISLGFNYDWFNVVAVDTGSSTTDTVRAEYGIKTYTDASGGTAQNAILSDTVWTVVPFIRDSTWTNTNGLMVGGNSQKAYSIWVSDIDLLRFRYANQQGTTADTSCVWKFYGTFNKKK